MSYQYSQKITPSLAGGGKAGRFQLRRLCRALRECSGAAGALQIGAACVGLAQMGGEDVRLGRLVIDDYQILDIDILVIKIYIIDILGY